MNANQNTIDALETAATTSRKALVDALKAADAYAGHSRDNMAALQAHTAQVIADLQAAGAPAEEPADETPRCVISNRRLSDRQLRNAAQIEQALAGGTSSKPGVTVVPAAVWYGIVGTTGTAPHQYGATGWRTGNATQQPSTWNPHFMAAVRNGLQVVWAGEKRGTGTLTFTQLDDDAAAAQVAALQQGIEVYKAALAERRAARPAKGQSASRKAAREQAISKATAGKLATAIAAATAQDDGTIVLDGDALALAGVGAGWAKTSNAHLQDASHVRARTLAAIGYTGTTSRGSLVLTPVAADKAQQAS